MSLIARWLEQVNNLQIELINTAAGNTKEDDETWWQRYKMDFYFIGFLCFSIFLLWLTGYFYLTRILMFVVGFKFILYLWSGLKLLKKKVIQLIWKR